MVKLIMAAPAKVVENPMPYKSVKELPEAQTDQYNPHQKKAFLKAFNSTRSTARTSVAPLQWHTLPRRKPARSLVQADVMQVIARGATALLAGATGLVGRALLPMLLASGRYDQVHVLVRRAVPDLATDARLVVHQVDFARLPAAFPRVDDVFIALGTTIKLAGSEAAFRQVDLEFVVNTARAARATGATRLAVVSALGADPKSHVFYNRVKGEMQDAVTHLGYPTVVIAQPALLLGDRAALGQPARRGERWAARLLEPLAAMVPKGVRPIPARAVAAALMSTMADAVPGVLLLKSADMQAYDQRQPAI